MQVLHTAGALKGLAAAMEVTEQLVNISGDMPTFPMLPSRLLTSRGRLVTQVTESMSCTAGRCLQVSGRAP